MHLISCSLALRVGMSNSRSSDGHRDTRSDTLTPGSSSLRASSLLVRPWEWRGASQPRLLCSSLYEEKGSISSVRVRGGRRRIGTPITLSDQIPFSTICEPVWPLTYWQVLQQGHQDAIQSRASSPLACPSLTGRSCSRGIRMSTRISSSLPTKSGTRQASSVSFCSTSSGLCGKR